MGGETFLPPFSSTEGVSSLDQDFSHESLNSDSSSAEDCSIAKPSNGGSGLHFGEFSEVSHRISSERQRRKVYTDVLRSYDDLRRRAETLEEGKRIILSYIPGSWLENAGGMSLKDYDVPKITSLLLIGPKGSGKSSLVNKISRVLEDDIFPTERAQVSLSFLKADNSSTGGGTYFLHEYIIPRGLGSFCLYDSRSLSDDSSENANMLKCWMTKGVHHGELVTRKSDSLYLKARLNCKARQSCTGQVRAVNFVIFVVNGISILESMESDDGTNNQYTQMITSTFNNPLLSFKDDKPVVVVTHGDLLSRSDRARVRVHVGELLGISPTRQIFDIPDDQDSATALTIIDMLHYCLERADRNLPGKDQYMSKRYNTSSLVTCWILLVVMAMAVLSQVLHSGAGQPIATTTTSTSPQMRTPDILNSSVDQAIATRATILTSPQVHVDWDKIRYLWLGDEY